MIARAVIIYDESALSADAASRDVMAQMEAVEQALVRRGITVERLAVGLDLAAFKRGLRSARADVVYNLVESLDGADRLQAAVTMLLEAWHVPFTGCAALAMALANDKLESKRILAGHGIPVAECALLEGGALRFFPGDRGELFRDRADWIVKAVSEHASVHLDDSSVLRGAAAAEIAGKLRLSRSRHGIPFFAERFIDGREFNLSAIGLDSGGAEVFPPAEITFHGLPEGVARIVGYAAKWHEESTEYKATPRVFVENEPELAAELSRLALAAWNALGLTGYARVDFRVDAAGRPFVLEANANPCLHPGAGFAAAAARGGIGYEDLIMRLGELPLRSNRGDHQ